MLEHGVDAYKSHCKMGIENKLANNKRKVAEIERNDI